MQPDSPIVDLARKTAKSLVDHGSIPMATLKESIKLHDKVDELLNKEIEFPEPVEEVSVKNFPEVQKVEITNFPEEKDDTEELALLKEIASELKKKEEYAHDIEIDATLKEKLRGEKGDKGKDGKNGRDGKDGKDGIDGKDAVLDSSFVKRLDDVERIAKQNAVPPTTPFINGQRAKNLNFPSASVSITGDTANVLFPSSGITVYTETPSGAIDSANKTYTVAHTITAIFILAINGQFLHPTTDYSASGTTITMVNALDVSLSGTAFTVVYY